MAVGGVWRIHQLTKTFFETIQAEIDGLVNLGVETWAWSNAFNFPVESSFEFYASKKPSCLCYLTCLRPLIISPSSHLAHGDFSGKYWMQLFLEVEKRKNQVIPLHLKAELSNYRRHVCQKLQKAANWTWSLILLAMNFARPLMSAPVEEVLRCSMWQSTSAYWPVGSPDSIASPDSINTFNARLTCGNHRVPDTWATPSSVARAFNSCELLEL